MYNSTFSLFLLKVLDKKFEEKLGSVKNREKEGEKADKYEGKIIAEKEDDFEAEDEDENTQQKEQQKSKPNMKSFVESLKGFQVCSLFVYPSTLRGCSQFQRLSRK